MKTLYYILTLFLAFNLSAQKQIDYYQGGHYGAHQPWNYVSKITTHKQGDTLRFERYVYEDKSKLETGHILATDRVTMIMSDENNVQILSDSLSFNWPNGPKCFKVKKKDLLEITFNDPKRINFDFEVGEIRMIQPTQMTFTSVAALELYLKQCNLFEGFEKDFFMADDGLRPFRIRVLGVVYFDIDGEKPKKCYDISINALDKKSLHSGKFFMEVDSKTVLKREFVSNELKHKSVVHEYRMSQ